MGVDNGEKEVWLMDEGVLLLFAALTPAHFGAGQAVGVVDQPLQREVQTDLPVAASTGIKGALRSYLKTLERQDIVEKAFGSAPGEGASEAGVMGISDGRLLVYPGRSAIGLTAWLTSPIVWTRFRRDASMLGVEVPEAPKVVKDEACLVASEQVILEPGSAEKVGKSKVILLESYCLGAEISEDARTCAEFLKGIFNGTMAGSTGDLGDGYFAELSQKLVFVSDDVFRDVTKHGAEIVARISVSDKGPASNLWYEELLPADSVLYALVWFDRVRLKEDEAGESPLADIKKMMGGLAGKVLQMGGGWSIGRGMFSVKIIEGGKKEAGDDGTIA